MNNDRFKFRVWDKERWFFPDNNFLIDSNGVLYRINSATSIEVLCRDDFTIQQCTGLKDKNGKLIYEEDIVKDIYPKRGHLCVVIYRDDVGYVLQHKNVDYITCNKKHMNQFQIIGNIYENPELLENE